MDEDYWFRWEEWGEVYCLIKQAVAEVDGQ